MSFFNKKEDVIEVQLTPYGRRLLADGKFKPVRYAFYDDEVIYDSAAAGFTETQNSAQPRILEDTPNSRVQSSYSGRETAITEIKEKIRGGEIVDIQQTPDKNHAASAPLGTSSHTSNDAPSWRVKALEGEITSFVQYVTGSMPTQKIPQLQINPEYKTFLVSSDEILRESSSEGCDEEFIQGLIRVSGSALIMQIEEENTPFYNENFDMEIYEIETVEQPGVDTPSLPVAERDKVEKLKPLQFLRTPALIKDGILLDEEEVESIIYPETLDSSYAEYFFNISVDREISDETICELRGKLRNRNQYYVNDDDHCTNERTSISRSNMPSDDSSGDDC